MTKETDVGSSDPLLSRRGFIAQGGAAAASLGVLAASSVDAAPAKAKAAESIIVNGLEASTMNEHYLQLARQGGIDCVNTDFGPSTYGFVYEFRDRAALVKTVGDIHRAKAEGKLAVVQGLQAARAFEEALFSNGANYPLGSFKQMVKVLHEHKGMGLGLLGLCYNTTNVFGSGCLDHNVPLTRAGQRLVAAIHENRIILDVGGHTGERTSLDALERSKGVPVVCTHTNFARLNANARAIPDRLAEAIAATGGVIGITAVSAFHTRNAGNVAEAPRQATLDQHLDQYDYGKRLVGADHLGLGPDFIVDSVDNLEMDPEDSVAFPAESMGPGKQTTVAGFENISKLPNLIAGLKQRGWTQSELDKLLGANWLRVYAGVWGS
jgi:membrane dipeptidase